MENTMDNNVIKFKHACSFLACAEMCCKEPMSVPMIPGYNIITLKVNASFSCEIFLKTMIFMCLSTTKAKMKKINRTHSLVKLWEEYSKCYEKNSEDIKKQLEISFDKQDTDFFERSLNIIDKTFVEWRYFYEKESLEYFPGFLLRFAYSLRNACSVLLFDMNWDEYSRLLF